MEKTFTSLLSSISVSGALWV